MPSRIEFPFGLGARYKRDPEDYVYRDAARACAADLDRPTGVDNRHLFAQVPVWNQGKEGACTGMAVAAVLSVMYGLELSPRDAFDRAKRHDEWPGEEYDGSSLRAACKAAVAEGCCAHPLWPWAPFNTGGRDPGADADAALHKLGSYERVNSQQEMLHAIWTVGCCLVTVDVHTGWIRPTAQHRIRYSSRYALRGIHATLLCGYDEMVGYWLLRNSWRDDWGDGGYAWLSFDDLKTNLYDAWVLFAGE